MVKIEMDLTDMMRYPRYRSIIYLTQFFQGPDTKNGLLQKHYRYALQKDARINGSENFVSGTLTITNVFGAKGEKLDQFYKDGTIIKDSVPPGNSISNYLKLLVKRGYLHVINPGEKNKKYRISLSVLNEYDKTSYKTEIDSFPHNYMIPVNYIIDLRKTEVKAPHETVFTGSLFGFPTDYKKILPDEDVKEIEKCVSNIYTNLVKINNIKYKYNKGPSMTPFYGTVVMNPMLDELIKSAKEDPVKLFKEMFKPLMDKKSNSNGVRM